MKPTGADGRRVINEIRASPEPLVVWLAQLWHHRNLLNALARADFQVRYKRASFGVLWAVFVPMVQAALLALLFSRLGLVRSPSIDSYGAYVLAGVFAWSYFAAALAAGVTSIVDGSGLTEKLWFPRAILPLVPCVAGCYSLVASLGVLLAAMPIVDGELGTVNLLLVPATVLLVAITASLSLVLSALHVYFRDVRFLVQAGLLMLFYGTPLIYSVTDLGPAGRWLSLNPLTGVLMLFQAAVGQAPIYTPSIVCTVAIAVGLGLIGISAHREHDRLFVDQL